MTCPEYYKKNKEKILAQTKDYYQRNKEERLVYQKQYRQNNKVWRAEKAKAKRQSRLLEAIQLLGGECSDCSTEYDPCQYDFHHLDPKEKEFTIGENMLVGKVRFFNEISKCVLLCANCHRLRHKESN